MNLIMDESELKKLQYISRVTEQLDRKIVNKCDERGKFPKWNDIDKFSCKLLNNFLSREQKQIAKQEVISKSDVTKQLEINLKKMNVLHLFLNTGLISIIIKYIDIIERVRFGSKEII